MSNDEMVDTIFEFNHKLHKFLSNETSNKIKKKIRDLIRYQLAPDKKIMHQLQRIQEGDHNMPVWSHLLNASSSNVKKNSSQKRL
ncbi:MAG: hypothetical protein EB824_03790 [Thaumarchaeota archaeon S15]|nr:MAG: hypothetical protein EB824_03790 [Thaumarchaeota archaeon S15]